MKPCRIWIEVARSSMLLSLAFMLTTATAASPTLELVATIPLAEVKGRIDHLAVDPKGRRVFVAALGNDTVEVVDTERNGRQTIRGLGEPQGVLYLPGQNRLVIANGAAGRLDLVDVATLGTIARVTGLDPSMWDESRGRSGPVSNGLNAHVRATPAN